MDHATWAGEGKDQKNLDDSASCWTQCEPLTTSISCLHSLVLSLFSEVTSKRVGQILVSSFFSSCLWTWWYEDVISGTTAAFCGHEIQDISSEMFSKPTAISSCSRNSGFHPQRFGEAKHPVKMVLAVKGCH
ncbi:hypothetical protein JEQ12_015051 [Ovis aries]|uniref:Uncharacterized protein n=1 Tax=Ovis aries TaxID=9940 RepID=A0A836AKE2_SHEEP|nr:hypothetical protein JEQ12_015051 [Ovis aries]